MPVLGLRLRKNYQNRIGCSIFLLFLFFVLFYLASVFHLEWLMEDKILLKMGTFLFFGMDGLSIICYESSRLFAHLKSFIGNPLSSILGNTFLTILAPI